MMRFVALFSIGAILLGIVIALMIAPSPKRLTVFTHYESRLIFSRVYNDGESPIVGLRGVLSDSDGHTIDARYVQWDGWLASPR